jgi:hypothetical protein
VAGRTGIDLSSANAALAHVRDGERGPELRGFALIEAGGELDAVASELRQARRQYHLPRRAEVVAWPGEPRSEAPGRAGFTVERVISPAEALARVARLQPGGARPGAVTAMLALHSDSGALAIVRDGEVLHEAALTWSPVSTGASPLPGRSELLRRYAFLAELTEYLRAGFAALRHAHGATVTDIRVCGSLPDLRSLTMPLADEFDLEVEALDAPDAFDIRMSPESAARARDVIASLQIALAAGKRWHRARGLLNRLGHRRAWIPAAALAAVLLLALVFWLRPEPTPVASRPAPSRAATGVRGRAAPTAGPPARQEPAAVGTAAKESATASGIQPPAPARERPFERAPTAKPATPPTPSRQTATRPAAKPQGPAPVPAMPPRRPEPAVAAPQPDARIPSKPVPSEGPQRPTAERLPVAPLEVTSILWSSDRKLAIINGRIVGAGDTVDGFEVVEVRQEAVIVRNTAGRRFRAVLGGGQKP